MRKAFLLAVTTIAALWTVPGRADWPSIRHDPSRTGVAASSSDITEPAVYWKAYVGGSLDPSALLVADVDKDGNNELVYVSGGVVTAKRPAGQTVWQTPPRGYQGIFAIDDFDGDGKPDVLVTGNSQAFLLAGADGTVEWTESSSDLGTLGSVRVADFNNDGRPDVLVEECHCCSVSKTSTGFAYTFSHSGTTTSASQLWQLQAFSGDFYSCGVPTVVFDGNGDGKVELAHAGTAQMHIVSASTGQVIASSSVTTLGQQAYLADCLPANVDGHPGQELVCFQATVQGTSTPRQVYVLQYSAAGDGGAGSVNVLWQNSSLADTVGGGLAFQPNAIVDLDGNGTLEVVVSGMRSTGVWTTYVLDAESGTVVGTLPNAKVAGTALLRSDGKVDLLTTDGKGLTAWLYTPGSDAASSLQTSWTLAGKQTLTRIDPTLLRTARANTSLVTPDLDQDKVADLLTAPVSAATALYGYSATGDSTAQLGTFAFPSDVNDVATWIVSPLTTSYPQLVSMANDGLLRIFDDSLSLRASLPVSGFCAGGFRNSPVVASMAGAGGTQSLFVTDSRGALLRFDPQTASLASPPQAQWAVHHCGGPSVIASLDGARPGVVCRSVVAGSSPPLPSVQAVRGNGTPIWNVQLPSPMFNDALPGSPDSSGAPAILLQTIDPNGQETTRSLSGSTGAQNWATSPITIESGLQPFAAADWNSDGVMDVISVINEPRAISGVDGSSLTTGTFDFGYGVPIVQDLGNTGSLDAIIQGGYSPAKALQHDLVTSLWTQSDTRPQPMGALVDCSGTPELVEGSVLYPSRLYVTPATGSSAGTSTYSVLAGGKSYASESAATSASAYLGQLSDVAVGTNVSGSGSPMVLVGSTDGWLYGIDACAGTLQFSLSLGESVCGAVLGDTNGDGLDEILVSTSGGYVYDVRNQDLPTCGPVIDTDPLIGATSMEVSQIVSESTLFGSWPAVSGATGYQVAIIHHPEGIISNPQWQDVGDVLSATVTGLPLLVGQTYYFAVRAVGVQGTSPDCISPGVTVVTSLDSGLEAGMDASPEASSEAAADASADVFAEATTDAASDASLEGGEAPGSAAGGGCSCRTAPTRGSDGPVAILGGALLLLARKRRLRRLRP